MNELDLFAAAIAITDPAKRAELLDRECAGRADLRQRLDLLLAAHAQSHPMLDRPDPVALNATTAYTPAAPLVGAVIAGRYKLLEEIGDGGMGTVWMAEQREPVKRLVALKLIKPGMDSRSVLARFEAERQALALMDHPNIAKVHDGGTTAEGRPFFVMELVKGLPLTEYCDSRRLSIRDRLELFGQVCSAVQHAHQKGVIHRDLKPSNVLVTEHDGKPVPKVIDFGLAKALNVAGALTDKTLHTGFGAVVGTPLYMAPEQVGINALDVDTRTDVYALGVILYELLTGTTPLEKGRLREAAWEEMRRLIREEEPPRPSARLSTSVALPSLAAGRQIEPARLTKLVRGELDWIVMKALEKDRNRRYETANLLAADVQRHLTGEPVLAVPPSAIYRLRKFARKHRGMLTTAGAFAAVLLGAAAVSSWLAVKAKRAEAIAEGKRIEADAYAREAGYNAGRLHQALEHTERLAASLQVDLDLTEIRSDPRVGILRLASRLKKLPPDSFSASGKNEELGEFVTAAVLATGQSFAPLLPPITHDSQKILQAQLTSGGDRLLTRGADKTARLWDPFTGRQIAILRRANETIVDAGLSPDGTTAFTLSLDGVIRLWETRDGAIRAAIDPRGKAVKPGDPSRSNRDRPEFGAWTKTQLSNDRVLTYEDLWERSKRTEEEHSLRPVELWDAKTGRSVAQLGMPTDEATHEFFGNGRWVGSHNRFGREQTCQVFSAEDGRLVAKLNHEAKHGSPRSGPMMSPSGHTAATVTTEGVGDTFTNVCYVHFWDTTSWRLLSTTGPFSGSFLGDDSFESIADDLFTMDMGWTTGVFRAGNATPIAELSGSFQRLLGDRVLFNSGQLIDARTGRRLQPPKGREYHPDITRFAPGSRFLPLEEFRGEARLLDTTVEKSCSPWCVPSHFQANLGWVWLSRESAVHRLPPPDRLNIPPDLLELWAQVAVRGELGADGRFEKWDERTWEKKRQELASRKPPHPDFPFPGHVATDKLHWLRAEFGEAKTDVDKLRIARELLRRAELVADRVEAVRWRAEIAQRTPELAPPPREVK